MVILNETYITKALKANIHTEEKIVNICFVGVWVISLKTIFSRFIDHLGNGLAG